MTERVRARQRHITATRAQMRSYAETGANGFAAGAVDLDDVLRALEPLAASPEGAAAIVAVLHDIEVLMHQRGSLAEVHQLLGTLAANPALRWRVSRGPHDTPHGVDDDEGPTLVEKHPHRGGGV